MKLPLIATAVVLRDLGITSVETAYDRRLLQAKVYIAQRMGVPLGYGFCWGLTAPYSEDLMDDAIVILQEGCDDVLKFNRLNQKYANTIRDINALYDPSSAEDGSEFYSRTAVNLYEQK